MYSQVNIIDGGWLSSEDKSEYEPIDNISILNTSDTAV